MKQLLIVPTFLLACAGAFAQGEARTATLTQSVPAGTVHEDRAIHLTATNVVEASATARYTAGQSVTLQPGFVAQAGSVFSGNDTAHRGHYVTRTWHNANGQSLSRIRSKPQRP